MPTKTLQITTITPVFNEPQIANALDSILAQEGISGLEIIVVDGNSDDETVDVLEEYRDAIDVLIREPDDGLYDAMNKGIERASHDIVGILNADDRYQDQHVLRDVVETFEETDADLCYGDLVYVDRDDEPVRYWKSGEYSPKRLYLGWIPPHPTVFVRKSVYEKVGKFDLQFSIAADYELLLRTLLCHDLKAAYLNRVLVRMRTGGQSNESVRNILRANAEVYRAWRKNDIRGGFLVPFLKPARKITQYIRKPKE